MGSGTDEEKRDRKGRGPCLALFGRGGKEKVKGGDFSAGSPYPRENSPSRGKSQAQRKVKCRARGAFLPERPGTPQEGELKKKGGGRHRQENPARRKLCDKGADGREEIDPVEPFNLGTNGAHTKTSPKKNECRKRGKNSALRSPSRGGGSLNKNLMGCHQNGPGVRGGRRLPGKTKSRKKKGGNIGGSLFSRGFYFIKEPHGENLSSRKGKFLQSEV